MLSVPDTELDSDGDHEIDALAVVERDATTEVDTDARRVGDADTVDDIVALRRHTVNVMDDVTLDDLDADVDPLCEPLLRGDDVVEEDVDAHADDVFLKCDDDIVYFDLHRLADFIAFRNTQRAFFLVSANVVTNGVCAHFQQKAGAIPLDLVACELPPGGMCGHLWGDGTKAQALHRHFLKDPDMFTPADTKPIVWNERISINFIAWLGRDLAHIPDLMADDEHDLCYGVRKRLRADNCIFPGFVAAHLSFWKQDAAMDVDALLQDYAALASQTLASFINPRPVAPSPVEAGATSCPLALAG